MGTYLNPDNDGFLELFHSTVFVDKSFIIGKINPLIKTQGKYLCVSRPRRFGKTSIINLLVAFYSKGCDSREIFSNLKIAQTPNWDEKLNKYNVIQLDIQDVSGKAIYDGINIDDYINEIVLEEFKEQFPNINFRGIKQVKKAIQKVNDETNEQFIIILDEYDVLIRENVTKEILDSYLDFLNDLFKSLSTQKAIALGYLTGILPLINGDKTQSQLNNINEYSLVLPGTLAGYIGFTEDEVKEVCMKHDMDFKEMKSWYNGYNIGGITVYNPNSICEAVEHRDCDNYWTVTGTYEVISDHILLKDNRKNDKDEDIFFKQEKEKMEENIFKLMKGEHVCFESICGISLLKSNKNNAAYTYLIHLGYLTFCRVPKKEITNYKYCEKCYVPNREIAEEWHKTIVSSKSEDLKFIKKLYETSLRLFEKTLDKKSDDVKKILVDYYKTRTNITTFENEKDIQTILIEAYKLSNFKRRNYEIIQEYTPNIQKSDFIFKPKNNDFPTIIFELNHNKSINETMKQIENKGYVQGLKDKYKKILYVLINYNSEIDNVDDRFECIIEYYTK